MPRIKVVTDSSCDIPDALLRQMDITVAPLQPTWGASGATAADLAATLSRRSKQGVALLPTVEAPSVEDLTRLYRSLRDSCDGILSVHLSSHWSETVANALTAREAFGPVGRGGPFPVAVVDSKSASMGLGWIVLSLAKAAASGQFDLPRLVRMAGRLAEQTHVAFFTEQIDGLLRGGPGSRLLPQFDSLSSMRPLFHLEEGQVVVYEKTRTRAKARDALYNFVEDFPKIGEIAVFHTGAQNDVEHLLTRVGAIYSRERVLIMQPGAAVSAWLGPEALGVAVLEGEE